jgi:hypothetical protein
MPGIADDFTGTLEAAATFACQAPGAPVTNEVGVSGPPRVPVVVIDTETRHLSAEKASAVVRTAAESALRFAAWVVKGRRSGGGGADSDKLSLTPRPTLRSNCSFVSTATSSCGFDLDLRYEPPMLRQRVPEGLRSGITVSRE